MEKLQDSKTEIQEEKKRVGTPDGCSETVTRKEYGSVLIQLAKYYEPNFIMDEHFKKLFRIITLYMWNDLLFESEGHGSLDKGLFITGNVGVGKTLLAKLMTHTTRVFRQPLVTTNRICDKYQENGIEFIMNQYGATDRFTGYVFDDLGAERIPVNYMGNTLNVMERIILNRYEQRQHHLTHFTSNLQGDEIEKIYGSRVRSRLREMCNVFQLTGTDRRK